MEKLSKKEIQAIDDEIVELFKKYVPEVGMCETVGGEIIRAINRLGYRWWNDGDKFFVGYGVETCGSDALYLADKGFKNQISKMTSYYFNSNDDDYENSLNQLTKDVLNYVKENPYIFEEKNTDDSRLVFAEKADEMWGEDDDESDYWSDDDDCEW